MYLRGLYNSTSKWLTTSLEELMYRLSMYDDPPSVWGNVGRGEWDTVPVESPHLDTCQVPWSKHALPTRSRQFEEDVRTMTGTIERIELYGSVYDSECVSSPSRPTKNHLHPLLSPLPWRLPPLHLVCERIQSPQDLTLHFHNTDSFYLTPLLVSLYPL